METRMSKMRGAWVLATIAMTAGSQAHAQSSATAIADGRQVFQHCSTCHSLSPSQNGRGPTLNKIFGRRAGSVPGYAYSLALKNSGIIWNTASLQRYVSDPGKVVPGGKMEFAGIANPKQIQDLLAYLRQAAR